jgi:hypothetical protein
MPTLRSSMWVEAMEFMAAQGVDWPAAALAHMSELVAADDFAGLEQWHRVVALLTAFYDPQTQH